MKKSMSFGFKMVVGTLFCLGVITWFLGDKPNNDVTDIGLSFDEFDAIIKAPVAQITAVELAEFLIHQEHHYNLIDLQEADAQYRIPTAEAYTLDEFLHKSVAVNETILIYSAHEIKATQLYNLLLIRGYFNVKVLVGGLQQWRQQILIPDLSTLSDQQRLKREELTEFFGGSINNKNIGFKPQQIQLVKKVKSHQGC